MLSTHVGRRRATSLLLAALAAACAHPSASKSSVPSRPEAQVEDALRRYEALAVAMDHAGIARLFASDGELANEGAEPIRGPAAIRRFLEGFSSYKVLADSMTPTETKVDGSRARQIGVYRQRVKIPDGSIVEVSGGFEALWVKGNAGEWLIRRLGVRPAP